MAAFPWDKSSSVRHHRIFFEKLWPEEKSSPKSSACRSRRFAKCSRWRAIRWPLHTGQHQNDTRGQSRPRGGPQGAGGGEEPSHSGSLSVTTTDALFAANVQRKVSNGVAQFAAAGSSLGRRKIAATPAVSAIDGHQRRHRPLAPSCSSLHS